VVLRKTGEVFATNPGGGAVYRISPDRDTPELFIPAKSVGQANGIALSADDRVLFVAGWVGVARVDLATRDVRLLGKARNISDAGIDGLYFHHGSLIGIQNPDLHPGRVLRYVLNTGLDSIERAEVLETYNPLFAIPTTGTLVGDSLFFVANPQLDKLLDAKVKPPLDSLQDLQMVRLTL
jgi:hypothetical protein